MDNKLVLLDADLCNMILEDDNNYQFFQDIFNILNYKPAIHTYVYNEELKLTNKHIVEFVKSGFIQVIEYNKFLYDDNDKEMYFLSFIDYYDYMNGKKLDNIQNFEELTLNHKSMNNIGEIHSLLTAFYLNIPVFMSNDNGAKDLAHSKINSSDFTIIIKNVCDVLCDCKLNNGKLDKRIIRSLLKKRTGWKDLYNNI